MGDLLAPVLGEGCGGRLVSVGRASDGIAAAGLRRGPGGASGVAGFLDEPFGTPLGANDDERGPLASLDDDI